MLPEVRGLHDFWSWASGRALPPPLAMSDRIMLDALGLGLSQTLKHCAQERPDLAAFEAWILATTGAPDPIAIARYHAWLDGAPSPEAVRATLHAVDAMEPVLDAGDLAHWEAEGYVIVRGAVTADEAGAAADLLWQLAEADPADPESWYANRPGGIMIEQFQHPAQAALRRSPRVHKAYAQLWETADLWTAVDRMSFNPPARPGSPGLGVRLHWDVSLALPMPFATQGILYLTDTAADQGALELVPGFHHALEPWLAGLGDRDPRQEDLSDRAITVGGGAGDLVIWRQDLPHGASPNRADKPRMAQYLNMYAPGMVTHPAWR